MKVRLIGTPSEVATALDAIRAVLHVVEVSRPYPSRRNPLEVRLYADVTSKENPR